MTNPETIWIDINVSKVNTMSFPEGLCPLESLFGKRCLILSNVGVFKP